MNEFKVNITSKSALQNIIAQKAEALGRGGAAKDVMERKRAAQEFASFLYLEVLKAMRATLPKGGLFENDSLSRDIYTSMFDTEVARVLAKRDAEGFTKTVERAIKKMVPIPSAEGAVGVSAEGVVSSSFGMRRDPVHGQRGFHAGENIAALAGAEVKAASGGKVTFSGPLEGYGNLVEIDYSGGMATGYGHKAANLVAVGEQIEAGQAIAIVGTTGRDTGVHLHFEVRQDEKPVNPARMIGSTVKGSKISSML